MRNKFLLLFTLVGISCNDFFVNEISDVNVVLLSPANSTITTRQTNTFIWEEVKHADRYHLQIAYPSFANIQYYVADTNLYYEQFMITLSPGTYQWRVKAINSVSESAYSTIYDLTIDTTSDLSNQSVILITPSSSAYLNTNLPSFVWQQMSIADSYNLIIKSGTNWTTGSVLINDTISTPYYNLSAGQELNEGSYIWGIRAINSLSYTLNYSTSIFYIDTTNPPSVNLISPAHNSLQTIGSITFNWQQTTDVGNYPSPRRDSFYLYSDTAMTNLLYRDVSTNSTITKTLTNAGTYRWVIKTYDAAGNSSALSSKFDFVLQ